MTPNHKRLREVLDRQSRERQRMAEIAAIEGDLSPELRSELETLKNGALGLARELRGARAAIDADDQTATHAEPDTEALELAGVKRRTSFSSYLVVVAEHRGSASENGEMILQEQISLFFSIRIPRFWFKGRVEGEGLAGIP